MFFSKKAKDEVPELPEPLKDVQVPETPEAPQPQKEVSAPLFVKIEKYREVLRTVHEIKVLISGLKQITNVLQELEAVRNDALKILRATLQRLERSSVEVDTELLRPRGFDMEGVSDTEIQHVEGSLHDLQKQLSVLRKELQELR